MPIRVASAFKLCECTRVIAGEQSINRSGPNDDEFDDLIAREQEFLRALIRMIGVARPDVPDVLQDANLYLIENRSCYIPGSNFRAWAAQVVRFRSLNYFRSRQRRPMVNLSEQALDLIAAEVVNVFDETQERLRHLHECMEKLPEDQRRLVATVYRGRQSLKKIAADTGQSHAAIRKTISRIRQALKTCIESKPLE